MANSSFFHWTSKVDSSLPAWITMDMFSGKFKSPNVSAPAAVIQSNINMGRSGKLTNGIAKAILRAMQTHKGYGDAVGSNTKFGIAEYTLFDGFEGPVGAGQKTLVVYDSKSGDIRISVDGTTAYNFSSASSAPVFFAMWGFFMANTKFEQRFNSMLKLDPTNAAEREELCAGMCYLADYIYSLCGGKNPVLPLCELGAVDTLTNGDLTSPKYRPMTYTGVFEKFVVTNHTGNTATKGTPAVKATGTASLKGAYKFNDRVLTAEEKALVPELDDKYIINQTLLSVCNHIKKTTGRPNPVRNILLRGEPGTGKTELYVGVAYLCDLPLYRFAANAMTEPFDLFGQFVPVDENGEQTGPKMPLDKVLSGMPSAEDISNDPVFAYQSITGLYKADATATECMAAMFNLAQKSIDVSGGQQHFKFVPGQLVYALKNGGVWGFDEVTLPQNPGVVPALNPAMDTTKSITLPTGEIVRRHPDCIIVGTTNIDLEGCRRMNQAWQDRCQLIIDLEEPDDAELTARVKAMTGFNSKTDGKLVDFKKFIRFYHEAKAIAKKKRLDDGTIGPRKLADWVMSTIVTEDPVASAKMTIIPGATADPEGIAELTQKLGDIF